MFKLEEVVFTSSAACCERFLVSSGFGEYNKGCSAS